ncbi:MAG TPA: phosphoglycerate dehydrogenase [Usitatibacteraceae bacterium]|nr:phosphoglycerate dehydrogenase [Usitatibacteraceae bacterium]
MKPGEKAEAAAAGERFRVATWNAISAEGLRRFPAHAYRVEKALAEPDAILLRSHVLEAESVPASVKAIARSGAGVNNIPVAEMSRRGIPVFNAPGANANAVKELVMAAIFVAARNFVAAIDGVRALAPGPDFEQRVEEGKKAFAGVEVRGKTLGVIGLGAIGGLVADAALKLGLRVVGYDPMVTGETVSRLPASVRLVASVDECFAAADFLTLHVPLSEGTRHLADARRIALARPGAVLLNFSRAAIVDEEAVVAAVSEGRLKTYVCDFPSPRFAGHRGIIALPHLGASTEEAEEASAAMVIDQLRDFLEEGEVRNAVNFPAVEMPRESPHRVAIANANVPNMLGMISTTMARSRLNIHNMVNKSKGEMAYTLVDLDSEVGAGVLEELSRIPGVLSVRLVPPLAEPLA